MLNNIEKKNPFGTPENYFQQFNVDIMSQLPKKQSKKIVPLWKSVTKWAVAAAVMVGVAVVAVNQLDNNQPSVPAASPTEVVSSLEDDYYSFIEEEATQSMYMDAFYAEN